MNEDVESHIAAAKVIAAGSISDDWLRATIMLAPSYAPRSAGPLARWPSQMITWLRSRNFTLSLLVKPVKYAGAAEDCVTLPQGDVRCLEAHASAVKATWNGIQDVAWIDQLWAEAFDAKKDANIWSVLAKVIADSSGANAFSKGVNGMAGDGTNHATVSAGQVGKTPVSGNGETATLDWILPSSQAELSLLLEYKRALELCDSAKHALDKQSTAMSNEIDCSMIARQRPSDPAQKARLLELKKFSIAAHAQYSDVYSRTRNFYSEAPCGPLSAPASHTSHPESLRRAERPDLEERLHEPLDSYEAANQPQHFPEGHDKPGTPDALAQVFYSLQASPTLSRLFGLTIDVQLRGADLREILGQEAKLTDGSYFLYLAMNDGSVCRNPFPGTIYTFAKYRPGLSRQHFWPVSRAEVALGRSPLAESLFDLTQYEGVMLGGKRLYSARGFVNRFELSSLDVRSACEAALDRRAVDLPEEELKRQCLSASPAQRPAAIARKTFVTAGLVVLDRGRQQQAVSQFAARIAHQEYMSTKPMVLDAEDLTIGYRIDVGVPLKGEQPSYAWRGLMARNMAYGIGGLHAQRVRGVSQGLFLEDINRKSTDPDIGWRQCLEDGLVALPARLIPQADGGKTTINAYVEEAIGSWAGEPMSVLCAGSRATKVMRLYGLPSGCVVRAPTSKKDPQRRIPALRFGWPYRVGLRPVYSGGISVPLEMAAHLYDLDRTESPLGGALTIPAVPATSSKAGAQQPSATLPAIRRRDQLRRFLRHERVDSPFLLLPEQVALRRNGPMGYERAAHVIIRTAHGAARARENPVLTQRVFVAPGVSQSFAAMHGVFDKSDDQYPKQGLSSGRFGPFGVRFDAEQGGFPVVTSDYITGFNGVPYLSSRRISTDTHGDKPDSGDLVYATSEPSGSRKTPYYPDPSACAYVIAVRVAGTSTYLDGKPCVISAYPNGFDYPHARPLVITVQPTPKGKNRTALPQIEDILSWPKDGSKVHLGDRRSGATGLPGAVEALLYLAPGDDFEIDVWCIPNEIDLTKRFAVIEAIGSLAIARAKDKNQEGDDSPPSKERVCDVLSGMLPSLVCDVFETCLIGKGTPAEPLHDWMEGCGGPGGLPAPGPESLRAIGRAIYQALIKRPLDEIAAVRTLRATHATDKPSRIPEFTPSQGVVSRVDGPIEPSPFYRIASSQGEPNRFSATGNVLIHWPTTGSLEIGACMASPSSDRFDDVRRSRALRDQRLGTWPKLKDGSLLPARQIFGFDVSTDGNVSLLKTEISLYRLDDIPLEHEGLSKSTDGIVSIPLNKIFDLRGRDALVGTGKPTFQFADGLARLLDFRITAYARHHEQMQSASVPAQNGKWLRNGQPLSAEDSSHQSAYMSAWLPASVRPAEPSTRTPVPIFQWLTEQSAQRLTRRSLIRIPLMRPWFSAGEDERLGIVIWPPCLFTQDPEQVANDLAQTVPEHGAATGRLMNLTDFHDEDLGPGGKFITRWGGDPIKSSPSPQADDRHTFIPAKAFLDFTEDIGTGFKAELVPNASMPVRIGADNTQNDDSSETVPLTLKVSLLTYQPKFDVFEQQWYVDVAIEHEREADPFLRLGLVRYQAHAPERLQVSYPVTQWTQLLPRRTVQARRTKTGVFIRIEGLAKSNSQDNVEPDKERSAVSKLVVRVVREFDLDFGLPGRRVVAKTTFGAGDSPAADRGVWEGELPLITNKNEDAREHAKYFVVIEEVEARLPATYANEPVSHQMAMGRTCSGEFNDDLLLEAGPRFLARIAL